MKRETKIIIYCQIKMHTSLLLQFELAAAPLASAAWPETGACAVAQVLLRTSSRQMSMTNSLEKKHGLGLKRSAFSR